MEASAALSLQSPSWIGPEKVGRKRTGVVRLSSRPSGVRRVWSVRFGDPRWSAACVRTRRAEIQTTSCYEKPLGSENFNSSLDEALILKRKAEEVLPYLSGRCIYLVGMMGSGKTTVGKILSQAVGVSSVAQIFQDYSEDFFRDSESKVLKDLSSMRRLVVATGGGAVIRPINWQYMKQGITVWLDVPLETLARRIAAVGTASRPLLNEEPGDPYTKAFLKLTTLFGERGKSYANADARVSLEDIASKKIHQDVSKLTPTDIAFEALMKIEKYVTENAHRVDVSFKDKKTRSSLVFVLQFMSFF